MGNHHQTVQGRKTQETQNGADPPRRGPVHDPPDRLGLSAHPAFRRQDERLTTHAPAAMRMRPGFFVRMPPLLAFVRLLRPRCCVRPPLPRFCPAVAACGLPACNSGGFRRVHMRNQVPCAKRQGGTALTFRTRLARIGYVLGTALIVAAAVYVVAPNWDGLSRGAKTALAVCLTAAFYGLAFLPARIPLWRRHGDTLPLVFLFAGIWA